MDRKNPGANFQILVDGKSLSYRDALETALDAGVFLKERHHRTRSWSATLTPVARP